MIEKVDNPPLEERDWDKVKYGKEAAVCLVGIIQRMEVDTREREIGIGVSVQPAGLVMATTSFSDTGEEEFTGLFTPNDARVTADIFDKAVQKFPDTFAAEVLPDIIAALRECAKDADKEAGASQMKH